MRENFGLIIESLVAVLLLLTISFCMVLNRRLKKLKADEHALKATISELITATEIAERAIAGLKMTVRDCDQDLGDRLHAGESLSRELARQHKTTEDLLSRLAQISLAARPAPAARAAAARARNRPTPPQACPTRARPRPPPTHSRRAQGRAPTRPPDEPAQASPDPGRHARGRGAVVLKVSGLVIDRGYALIASRTAQAQGMAMPPVVDLDTASTPTPRRRRRRPRPRAATASRRPGRRRISAIPTRPARSRRRPSRRDAPADGKPPAGDGRQAARSRKARRPVRST